MSAKLVVLKANHEESWLLWPLFTERAVRLAAELEPGLSPSFVVIEMFNQFAGGTAVPMLVFNDSGEVVGHAFLTAQTQGNSRWIEINQLAAEVPIRSHPELVAAFLDELRRFAASHKTDEVRAVVGTASRARLFARYGITPFRVILAGRVEGLAHEFQQDHRGDTGGAQAAF